MACGLPQRCCSELEPHWATRNRTVVDGSFQSGTAAQAEIRSTFRPMTQTDWERPADIAMADDRFAQISAVQPSGSARAQA